MGREERSLTERESEGEALVREALRAHVCERGKRQGGRERMGERIEKLVEGGYVLPKLSTNT